MYPLWERYNSLLIALLPAVYMYNRLLGLRGEDVRTAYSNAILSSRALLEDISLRRQRLEFVYEDALVLGNASVWLRRARNGGHKLFGKHRGHSVSSCLELSSFLCLDYF